MAKILIVDDDPDVVEATTIVLQAEGHETASASDRPSGEEKIASYQPDLVILDVMMNEQDDGIAMAQDLRHKGFDKPILMLTSLGKVTGLNYDKDESVVPVDVFLEKPVDPKILMQNVTELLNKAEE
jgi:DNA-binding response OmpR family regulator